MLLPLQDEDVSMAPSNIGNFPQEQFEGGALEIEVDSSQPAEEVQVKSTQALFSVSFCGARKK
jgi:hypothetical protein